MRTRLRHMRRRASSQETVWRRALPTEVAFWEQWIATRGLDWPEDFRQRFDPGTPLQEPLILEVLPRLGTDPVRILDVGAGPATWLGRTHPDRRLEITAVDPLGADYDRLLATAGLEPPVRTAAVAGEDLRTAFGLGSFDVAYARNSLDHSADPERIIQDMLMIVRPGGFVILRHFENEGEIMDYEELHQWNFSVRDGRLHIWNARRGVDVAAAFEDMVVAVRADVQPGAHHARWVTAILERGPA